MTAHTTTLVLGGTGKTGRRVAERLTALGSPVRIGSRSAEIPFHWEEPGTWRPALEGVTAVYVAYVPDISAPDAPRDVGAFARLAAATGVRRLVLLSAMGLRGALAAEEAAWQAGPDVTVVRGSWFAQNFSEEFMVEELRTGSLTFPGGTSAVPFTDLDDLADVAVAALTEDGHAGRTYEITGPRALTFHEVVAELSRATGREIVYRPVEPGSYAELLAGAGVPKDLAELVAAIAEESLDGPAMHPSDDTRRVLGRAPRDFTAYAEAAAAAGAWRA